MTSLRLVRTSWEIFCNISFYFCKNNVQSWSPDMGLISSSDPVAFIFIWYAFGVKLFQIKSVWGGEGGGRNPALG